MNTTTTQHRNRQAIADEYAGQFCRLNGKDARIVGRVNPFATVRTIESWGGGSAEFAWETVAKIMREGGNFTC